MSVTQILRSKGRDIIAHRPDDTIAEAVRTLAIRRIGAVLVLDANAALIGILSERDIVRAISDDGVASLEKPVSRYMTSKVVYASEKDEVRALLERMTEGKFRHLPIVDEGVIGGVVSIGDIVKFRLAETEAEAQALREYIST